MDDGINRSPYRAPQSPQLRITISRQMIQEAKERDSSHCMIAEALKQTLPSARRVSVDLQTIRFSDDRKGLRYTYLTPRVAQLAIVRFDQGDKSMTPFTFFLRGAQTTKTASRKVPAKWAQTPEYKANITKVLKEGMERMRESQEALSKARLIKDADAKRGSVPRRVGGKPPPMSGFGKIRAFGLRALER